VTDRLFIRHPDHPARNGYVTATAFENLWAKKGYVIEGESPPPELPEPGRAARDEPHGSEPVSEASGGDAESDGSTAATADQLNADLDEKAQLRAELEAHGIEVDGRWGLKRLRAEAATARETEAPE
jgi:hypothetical protein